MKHLWEVDEEDLGKRLDRFVANQFVDVSRTRIAQWIQDGRVLVNGEARPSKFKLSVGMSVECTEPPPPPQALVGEAIPIKIVYEDDHLAIVDKQAGLVMHPGAGHETGTLVNALLHHLDCLSTIGLPTRPGIVHRIDAGTTGLVVVAKNDFTHHALAAAFSQHEIERVYTALIWDHGIDDEGTIKTFYGRSPHHRIKFSGRVDKGKHAVTHWETTEVLRPCRLLKIRLETGRTHQIRVHFSEGNNPLVGDPLYGRKRRVTTAPHLRSLGFELGLKRQALHASTLGFEHPVTKKKMRWTLSLPADMKSVIEALRQPG